MARSTHGQGSIYRSPDGDRWILAVRIPLADGTKQRRRWTFRTRAEAVRARQDVQRQLASGHRPQGRSERLRDYLARWLTLRVEPPKRAANTYLAHKGSVERINRVLGSRYLNDLTPQDVQEAFDALAHEYAPGTLHATKRCLRTALGYAVECGLIERNPVRSIELPPETPYRPTAMTQDEFGEVLRVFDLHRLGALYTLLLGTALRKGEALGLMWTDLDLEAGTARIERQLQRSVDFKWHLTPPKTRSGVRVVPLPSWVVTALKQHRARQAEERLSASEWGRPELVFTDAHGKPLVAKSVTEWLTRLLEDHGLQPRTIRELRHQAASWALGVGMTNWEVAQLLGHRDTKQVDQTYGHVSQNTIGRLREAFERVRESG